MLSTPGLIGGQLHSRRREQRAFCRIEPPSFVFYVVKTSANRPRYTILMNVQTALGERETRIKGLTISGLFCDLRSLSAP